MLFQALLLVVIYCRLSSISEANIEGKIRAGSLLKFFEEAGAVVCTRYCNYTAADQSLRNVSLHLLYVYRTQKF